MAIPPIGGFIHLVRSRCNRRGTEIDTYRSFSVAQRRRTDDTRISPKGSDHHLNPVSDARECVLSERLTGRLKEEVCRACQAPSQDNTLDIQRMYRPCDSDTQVSPNRGEELTKPVITGPRSLAR